MATGWCFTTSTSNVQYCFRNTNNSFEIHLLLLHPALIDALFALIQLSLGVLILSKKTSKIGLLASVVWGLGVWYMGEGLGGLLSGHAMLLTGMPGAALIYAILALAILPHKKTKNKVVDERPAYWLSIVWAVFWIGGAIYQLLPGQNTVSDVASSISGLAGGGSPGWLSALQIHTGNTIQDFSSAAKHSTGYWFILFLAIIQGVIGLLIFLPHFYRKLAVGIGIAVSVTFWLVGQSLGGYYSGLATDPNSAPLFILLGAAILGSGTLDFNVLREYLTRFLKRLSDSMDTPSVRIS
jgi:hypothetical protein